MYQIQVFIPEDRAWFPWFGHGPMSTLGEARHWARHIRHNWGFAPSQVRVRKVS